MATLHDIRRRIATTRNIQQITRAMKMVAAAKLRRYQERMFQLRDYTDAVNGLLRRFLEDAFGLEHPWLGEPAGDRTALVFLSGDRGLCGSFNVNALRHAEAFLRDWPGEVVVYSVGKRGGDSLRRAGRTPAAEYSGLYDKPSFLVAQQLVENILGAFGDGRFDQVHICRPWFVNTMTQRFVTERLLPFHFDEPAEEAPEQERDAAIYLHEPSIEELGSALLSRSLAVQTHRAILEGACCEFAARMVAMDLATINADEMIQRLTLAYNRARQNSITKEILDIIGGAESLG